MVEGVDNPMLDMYDEKFYEVTKYLNLFNHLHTIIAYNTSDTFWKSLNAHEQSVFRMAIKIANLKAKAIVKNKVDEAIENMKSKGVEIIETDTAEFRTAISSNIEKILSGNNDAINVYKMITK